MNPSAKRRPVLGVISVAAALLSYVLVASIAVLRIAVRRFGFNGMDLLVLGVLAIVTCNMLGLSVGIAAVYRYRQENWNCSERRLSVWGLALNMVNSLLLYLLSKL